MDQHWQTELLEQAFDPMLAWEFSNGITYWNKAAAPVAAWQRPLPRGAGRGFAKEASMWPNLPQPRPPRRIEKNYDF